MVLVGLILANHNKQLHGHMHCICGEEFLQEPVIFEVNADFKGVGEDLGQGFTLRESLDTRFIDISGVLIVAFVVSDNVVALGIVFVEVLVGTLVLGLLTSLHNVKGVVHGFVTSFRVKAEELGAACVCDFDEGAELLAVFLGGGCGEVSVFSGRIKEFVGEAPSQDCVSEGADGRVEGELP